MSAITQMTRFKSDKTEEMIKNARNAKTIFENMEQSFFAFPVFTRPRGPATGWSSRAMRTGKCMARPRRV
jgi:hypothetical protein